MKNAIKILMLVMILLPLAASNSHAEARGRHRFQGGFEHHHDFDHWNRGYWARGWHDGRNGSWWVVGDYWYLYPRPVYPYPAYTAEPVYVAPPVVVQQPTQTVIVTQPSAGSEVRFANQPAPAIEANATSPTFVDSQGRTCREYQTSIAIGGVNRPAYGTACLMSDGSWHVVK